MIIKIKFPKNRSLKYIKDYFKNHKVLKYLSSDKHTFHPDLIDLYRIHQFIILNKRLTVLEFGTGWSSLIIQHALNLNKSKFSNESLKLKKKNQFELFVIDNEKKFLNISKKRSERFFSNKKSIKKNFFYSECFMTEFNGKFASHYKNLPLCNPDFIYVDGPSPFTVKNELNGFTTNHSDLMPMSCDILKLEHFLCPGSIILTDGRTANARFLEANLQRNWKYFHDIKNDQNLFYLDEVPLGEINKKQINFYNS